MIQAVKNTTDTFTISSLGIDVKLKPYTRAISRTYEETLLKGVVVGNGGETDTPAINGSRAEEEMIRLLFGLSLEQMDAIEHDDYLELKAILENRNEQKKTLQTKDLKKSEATLPETATA